MLTVRTSENTVITSFRLISERQDFSSVRTVSCPRKSSYVPVCQLVKGIYLFK